MSLARLAGAAAFLVALSTPARPQCQEAKLLPRDLQPLMAFGSSVALQGATAVIGTYHVSGTLQGTGAAYVFESSGGAWQQVQKLEPSSAIFGAKFGKSLALDGDWLAVGAPTEPAQGVQQAGKVFVFRKLGASWSEAQMLQASDPKFEAAFGWSVALWQDRLVVGAKHDPTFGLFAGAAYVFELQGSSWVQVQKLLPSAPEQGSSFGNSVAIQGDRVVVGAPGKDEPQGGTDAGAAYVFERGPSTWSQVAKLIADDANLYQFTGWAVELQGGEIYLGALGHSAQASHSGAVYVFKELNGIWPQSQKLLPADPQVSLKLGGTLAVSPELILSGAPGDSDHGSATGSVYVYRRDSSGAWTQASKVLAGDAQMGVLFSVDIAVSGNTLLVGANGADDACPSNPSCESGAAYVFKLGSDSVQYCSCAPPGGFCANADDHGGCRNSTGHGAVLSACGSGSAALDDLTLIGQWLPPGQPTLLFMGGGASQNPFGAGLLCIASAGQGVHRYPVAFASPAGALQLGPGLGGFARSTFPRSGQLVPGSTWHFQLWYRDPTYPCGSGFNLSNALQVQFTP